MFQWVERSPGDRLAEVADEHRLKFSLRGNDRQQRQLRHGRESVGEFVLRSEDQRRADDRGLAERLADRGLTVAFGATVIRRRARVGTDRRDVDKRGRLRISGRLSDVARTVDMHRLQRASEHSDQIDDRTRAFDSAPDAVPVSEIGLDKAELPDLRERLDEIVAPRIARGNADPNPAAKQEFADIAADESAAAEDGHKLFEPLDHRAAFASGQRR